MTKATSFLGIDFGTTKSTMAWFNPRKGQAEIIKNAESEEKTPSVVYFGADGVLVGTPAENMLDVEEELRRMWLSAKRFIAEPMPLMLPEGRLITPEDAVVEILCKLKRDAETDHFKESVERVVLTCPAAFSEIEREVLTHAAMRSGFRTVELLEEPVAAALAYAHAGLKVEGNLLVYDLGGGTFDLAVLARDEDGFRLALKPRGLRTCGGDDFDRALYDYCDDVARRTLQRPVGRDGVIDLKFLRLCRLWKETLTESARCDLRYPLGRVSFKSALDRSDFESLITRYVKESVALTRSVVGEARDAGHPVATAVLIGGSSRVPLVERLLRDALRINFVKWEARDLAVALGAAYHGWMLGMGTATFMEVREQWQRERPVESNVPGQWIVHTGGGSDPEWALVCMKPGYFRISGRREWVTDGSLARLKEHTCILELDLSWCESVTDGGLTHLKGFSALQALNLYRCFRVTNAGLAHLKGLTALQALNLYRCLSVSDAGLAHLTGLTSLQELDLCECFAVTDAGLAHLKKLASLHSLKLSHCQQVTDTGLAHLKRITSLLELHLSGCGQVTDDGLAHLSESISLHSLKVDRCKKVTDDGLAYLHRLISLQHLDLRDCWQVTGAGLAALRSALPHCKIKIQTPTGELEL